MSLKFVNYVLDNVHGYIGLTQVENEIERLPIFQRLRRIKQLGLANWIFPGSEHTRYTHSLGVMHIIDQMAIALNFSDDDRQLVRLAGMLHDIGHYPLSHLGEYAYKENTFNIENPIQYACSKVISKINSINESRALKAVAMEPTNELFHHERIGVTVINNSNNIQDIITRNCPNIDINDICDMITGNLERKSSLDSKVQLLHSELDADRIDYLLRDATFSGTSYGQSDVQSFIKNLCVKEHSELDVNVVGVNEKGVGTADQFLINRYLAYSQVIFQKHVAALTFMAEVLMYWMLNASSFTMFPKHDDLLDNIYHHERNQAFLNFTDHLFSRAIDQVDREQYGCPDKIFNIVKCLRRFQALELSDRTPIIVSSRGRNELYSSITGDPLYGLISTEGYCDSDRLPIFNSVTVTDHIPLTLFQKECEENHAKLTVGDDKDDVPDLDTYKTQNMRDRLLHGVAVIPINGDPKLLVDTEYSLVKDLNGTTLVKLAEYKLPLVQ